LAPPVPPELHADSVIPTAKSVAATRATLRCGGRRFMQGAA
jgi:hypothetical protein